MGEELPGLSLPPGSGLHTIHSPSHRAATQEEGSRGPHLVQFPSFHEEVFL